MTQAFVSSRVVTPEGVRPAAVIVDEGRIQDVREPGAVPRTALLHQFGDRVLLPGLVDSHVHVNEPGRTEWEGFATATRAAAAGGYTTLVDMPLNCLPETTTVAALEAKRDAAARPMPRRLGALGWIDGAEQDTPCAPGGSRRGRVQMLPGRSRHCQGLAMIEPR